MIEIEDVTFHYGDKETLSHIQLEIHKGECILLCGESGCGKTTITKLINGLIPHFVENGVLEGCTKVNGMKVTEMPMYELAEQVGSVFQNPKSQFFNTDSESEMVFGLENSGVEPEKIKERLRNTVSQLEMANLLNRNIFSMSGGEKQSLAFASVYAMNPQIFVLDEPTANLDAEAIERLRKQISKIKEEGRTIIIAEHRLYFLMDLIDRAVFLKKGKIIETFNKEAFKALTEKERKKMGLRSLILPKLNLQEAKGTNSSKGLVIEQLTCTIKNQTIFEKVNFSTQVGEILGITGHNGAGKTTLVRCLCGLIKEKDGKIYLDGRVLNGKQRNQMCFCVMQDVNHQLFSDSVWNECELSLSESKKTNIEKVLKAFDLWEFRDKHPMALSGGQKQRLAVATAVLSDKKILIFDEPTSGLDYRRMLEVSQMIRSLKENHIIIIVSHDFEFMEQTCDKIWRIS